MSYDLDGRLKSESRTKVNNLTNFSSNTNKRNEFHEPCYSSGLGRLIPSPTEKGKLFCRNCGQTFDVEETQKQQSDKQYKSKYPTNTKPFIVSKGEMNKKRKQIGSANDSLTEEDLDDLRKTGINVS